MERRNISLTAELAAEMDKHPDINWSDVCRSAIAQRLGQKSLQYRVARLEKLISVMAEQTGVNIREALVK